MAGVPAAQSGQIRTTAAARMQHSSQLLTQCGHSENFASAALYAAQAIVLSVTRCLA